MLFLADNTGQHPACATPQAGDYHNRFAIETSFGELCAMVKEARVSLDGLFLNADSGFDARCLRDDCFRRSIEANTAQNPRSGQKEAAADRYLDQELSRQPAAVERTNAWLNGFKTLLVRYETNVDN